MVNGASPGPAPASSSSRLTRSSWRTWPHRKLRRKVPRVDGALTTQPMAPAVPPVRNTSASSMQSPPASAEATRVIILSPAQVNVAVNQLGQTQALGQGDRQISCIGHQAVIIKGNLDAVGALRASIGCSWSGVGFVFLPGLPHSIV